MTCETCRCNKICDHNKYGFENCNNYVPEVSASEGERKKLIELIDIAGKVCCVPIGTTTAEANELICMQLADILIENGVIMLPCNVGDTVFCIWQYSDFTGEEDPFIEEATAVSFVLDGSVKVIPSGYSDKVNSWYRLIDVCFSLEDAEKALETLHQPQTKLTPTESTTESATENIGD